MTVHKVDDQQAGDRHDKPGNQTEEESSDKAHQEMCETIQRVKAGIVIEGNDDELYADGNRHQQIQQFW